MKKERSAVQMKLCVGLATVLSVSASADTIYSNSTNDLAFRFAPGNIEVGDEVNFGGGARYLTNFSFQFFGTNTFSAGNNPFAGSPLARVRFYLNDGPVFNTYPTPGTVLFDSGTFGVPTSDPVLGRSTFVFEAGLLLDFPVGGLFIPANTITWSVQFSGPIGFFDQVGLDIFDPPTVGSSLNDYWENNGGWQLKTNVVNMNFASVFQATPEPSFMALSLLAGLGLFFASRRNRKP